jgi:hypothetical protein
LNKDRDVSPETKGGDVRSSAGQVVEARVSFGKMSGYGVADKFSIESLGGDGVFILVIGVHKEGVIIRIRRIRSGELVINDKTVVLVAVVAPVDIRWVLAARFMSELLGGKSSDLFFFLDGSEESGKRA